MNLGLRLYKLIARITFPHLERMIPLPPVSQRREGLLPLSWVSPYFELSNDTEYLFYRLFLLSAKTMFVLLVLLFADVSLEVGMLVDQVAIDRNKLVIPVAYRNITIFPIIILTLGFYIRIHSSINMERDPVPVAVHPAKYDDEKKSQWVVQSACMVIIIPIVLSFSYVFVFAVARYLNAYNDVLIISAATAFVAAGLSVMTAGMVAHLLLLEKSYHHFDDLKRHLADMIHKRDEKTDKYKKTKNKGTEA